MTAMMKCGSFPSTTRLLVLIRYGYLFSRKRTKILHHAKLFSGEDWTTVLYGAMEAGSTNKSAVIHALFLVGWFLSSNCKYKTSSTSKHKADNGIVM